MLPSYKGILLSTKQECLHPGVPKLGHSDALPLSGTRQETGNAGLPALLWATGPNSILYTDWTCGQMPVPMTGQDGARCPILSLV